jgi:hypothetical protein
MIARKERQGKRGSPKITRIAAVMTGRLIFA